VVTSSSCPRGKRKTAQSSPMPFTTQRFPRPHRGPLDAADRRSAASSDFSGRGTAPLLYRQRRADLRERIAPCKMYPEGRPSRHVGCNPAPTTKIPRGELGSGNEAKWEYFRAMYERYHKAERKARAALLGEFSVTTGCNRKYAIRRLNGPRPEKQRVRRTREHKPQYRQADFDFGSGVGSGDPWSLRL
jgi:hypothetical protein